MTTLRIFAENEPQQSEKITDFDTISTRLHGIGVRLERWQADQPLGPADDSDTVIAAYQEPVDRLMKEYGFQAADVVALTPDHPEKAALREKFLDEHIHTDFEVRFFVQGKGLFYIHGDDGQVYGILCEQGDLISVPANTRHWFDMGRDPDFKCIRLFTTPEGWVAQYTGDTLARNFPGFEHFASAP